MSWHKIKNVAISALVVVIMYQNNWLLFGNNYFLFFLLCLAFLTLYTLMMNGADALIKWLTKRRKEKEQEELKKEEEIKKQNERTVANITVG